MFDDFKELLSVFNAHSVKYLIVGGYAVSFHAQPRATKDLDLFIRAKNYAVRFLTLHSTFCTSCRFRTDTARCVPPWPL
jgi:hypothetical protein